jgi:hypothetical protein
LWKYETSRPAGKTEYLEVSVGMFLSSTFAEGLDPRDVQTKFLLELRGEDASTALAHLDEPEILQRLRPSFAQSAPYPGSDGHAQFAWRGLCRRPRASSGAAATDH